MYRRKPRKSPPRRLLWLLAAVLAEPVTRHPNRPVVRIGRVANV